MHLVTPLCKHNLNLEINLNELNRKTVCFFKEWWSHRMTFWYFSLKRSAKAQTSLQIYLVSSEHSLRPHKKIWMKLIARINRKISRSLIMNWCVFMLKEWFYVLRYAPLSNGEKLRQFMISWHSSHMRAAKALVTCAVSPEASTLAHAK